MSHSLMPPEPHLRDICLALQARPEPIYLVGGYVRDYLMGRASHDLDFAVRGNALQLAREIADSFHGSFIPLDQEHDTGRALFQRGGQVDYVDLARVRGQDIMEDLAARDFTVNAIAIHVRDLDRVPLRWIDPLRGLEDIRGRVIRATSDRVFLDDPLRMLRAVRQAASLRFNLTPDTEALIVRDAPLIGQISFERMRDELVQIMVCAKASGRLHCLAEFGLLFRILPELRVGFAQALRSLDRAERLLDMLSGCSTPEDEIERAIAETFDPFRRQLAEHFAQLLSDERDRALIFRMAALFAGAQIRQDGDVEPQMREEAVQRQAEQAALALQRLRFSNREMQVIGEEIAALSQFQTLVRQEALDAHSRYRFFAQHASSGLDIICLSVVVGCVNDWPNHGRALWSSFWSRRLEVARQLLQYYLREWPGIAAMPRLINGDDLMRQLGIKPGPLLGELLERVREAQAVGEIYSSEEALALADAWLREKNSCF